MRHCESVRKNPSLRGFFVECFAIDRPYGYSECHGSVIWLDYDYVRPSTSMDFLGVVVDVDKDDLAVVCRGDASCS